jgi:hypothetical protein
MDDDEKKRYKIPLDAPIAVGVIPIVLWLASMVLALLGERDSDLSFALSAGMLLCSCLALAYSLRAVEIDSEIIRTHVPFRKARCGSMRWADVRAVGIYCRCGRHGRLFISTIPKVWYERDLTTNRFDSNHLVAFRNSKWSLGIIRQFYSGEIVEIQ